MAVPTWSTLGPEGTPVPLDLGFPGGVRYTEDPKKAWSFYRVTVGAIETARTEFTFVGLPSTFQTLHGPRKRQMVWDVTIRAKDLAELNLIESEIDAAVVSGAASDMADSTGRVHKQTVLETYAPAQGYQVIKGGTLAGWIIREGRLAFVSLAP